MIIHKTIAKNTGIGINACGMVNQNEAEQRDILINEKNIQSLLWKQRQLLKETWEHETSQYGCNVLCCPECLIQALFCTFQSLVFANHWPQLQKNTSSISITVKFSCLFCSTTLF